MTRNSLAIAAICAATAPACASPLPQLVPLRDVTVEYQVNPRNHGPIDVVVAIEAGGQRLRITSPALPTTILVDRPAGTAEVLLPMLRAYAPIKIARYDPQRTVLQGATFNRAGLDQVAGHDCTIWHAQSADGSADACITEGGVILRGAAHSNRKGEEGSITAVRVTFGPLPPDSFAIPPDFQPSPFRLDAEGPSLKGFSLKHLGGGDR